MVAESSLSISAPHSRTLSEHIADQLRRAILNRQLTPGQKIVESQIAKAMDTSRGPVRDALQLLESEGLVVRYLHRGTFVARFTIRDVEEIYTLRQAIESVALEYLIKHATEEQIDELDAHVQKMAEMAQGEYTPYEVTELDLDFHHTLCRLSGHGRVLEAWQSLSAQTRVLLLRHQAWNPGDVATRGAESHRRLVDLLRKRDAAVAQAELSAQLAAVMDGMLNSNPEPA